MKFFKILCLSTLLLLIPGFVQASNIEYCKGTQTTNEEDAVIQRLVPRFGTAMGCEIGNNCLLKWSVENDSEKFSIAWKEVCGPIINGKRQLGDEGKGSTFVCKLGKNKSVCCAPLGYERLKEFNVCSDEIIKQK